MIWGIDKIWIEMILNFFLFFKLKNEGYMVKIQQRVRITMSTLKYLWIFFLICSYAKRRDIKDWEKIGKEREKGKQNATNRLYIRYVCIMLAPYKIGVGLLF